MRDRLPAVAVRAGRDLLYLSLGLMTSILAFVVWVGGLTVSLTLGLLIIGLPLVVATAVTFRWTAELDRRFVALVDGRSLRGEYQRPGAPGFVARLRTTIADPQTWRDLAWLVVHSILGFTFGVTAVSLAASVLGLATLPAWYWSIPGGVDLGIWTVDSLGSAVATMFLAIPCAAVTAGLLRLMTLTEASLAKSLLGR
jgi:hypothetical protein